MREVILVGNQSVLREGGFASFSESFAKYMNVKNEIRSFVDGLRHLNPEFTVDSRLLVVSERKSTGTGEVQAGGVLYYEDILGDEEDEGEERVYFWPNGRRRFLSNRILLIVRDYHMDSQGNIAKDSPIRFLLGSPLDDRQKLLQRGYICSPEEFSELVDQLPNPNDPKLKKISPLHAKRILGEIDLGNTTEI